MDHQQCRGGQSRNGEPPPPPRKPPKPDSVDPESDDHRAIWGLVAREGVEELRASRELLRLLMAEVWDRASARCLVDRIQAAKERFERLIADASEIADPRPLDFQPCHLGMIFAEAWNRLIASRSPCQARLRQHGNGLDLCCRADLARLSQAFHNLLEESFEASEGPVVLTIHWSVGRLNDRPALRVVIRDEGPPLDRPGREEYLNALSRTRSGDLGLGLAAARAIIQRHGGRLRLRDHEGPGLEYIVILPRNPEPSAESVPGSTTE